MLPPAAERPKLRATLDRLSGAVEDLLWGGLTTASDATRQTLADATQEAARVRLLRLGAILRVLTDDLNRFNQQDALLSRRRLTLFLNRGWLIARGLSHALETGNEKEYDRINLTPNTQPLASADLVCMGVIKKVTASLVQFQFRFRAVTASGPVKAGDAVAWSFNQSMNTTSAFIDAAAFIATYSGEYGVSGYHTAKRAGMSAAALATPFSPRTLLSSRYEL